MEMKEKTGEAALMPRLLKELIRTPLIKELVRINLAPSPPGSTRELVKTFFWEDFEFSFGLVSSLPSFLNGLAEFLDELGLQLQKIPPHMLKAFILELGKNIEKDTFKNIPQSYAPLVRQVVLEDEETLRQLRSSLAGAGNNLLEVLTDKIEGAARGEMEPYEPKPGLEAEAVGNLINAVSDLLVRTAPRGKPTEERIKYAEEILQAINFGKLRRGLVARMDRGFPVLEGIVGAIVDDPVIFANVANILPPLLNHLLKLLANTISRLDLPPEILASAILNILDDLEGEHIGRLLNGACALINDLHEGSLVLGKDEPRFRPVLKNLLDGVFSVVDEKALSRALVALLEDLETVLTVLGDVLVEKPELYVQVMEAVLNGVSPVLRGLSYLLEKVKQLPPPQGMVEKIDFSEFAGLLNSFFRLLYRVLEANPTLIEQVLSKLYNGVDREQLGALGKELFRQFTVFAAREEILAPEKVAQFINPLLSAYNQALVKNPSLAREKASRYLEQLDLEQLALAVTGSGVQLSGVIQANPSLARAILKTFLGIVWSVIKGSFKRQKRPAAAAVSAQSSIGRQG
ncbi:MAG TPA: hypothetical protein PKO38_07235 [Bacillota bacterium]|nr:hypothetical protein [Bacillota bacterium]HOB87465.1 hypothetical protein [Bacillota bacterium]